jgi:hypothetical protein
VHKMSYVTHRRKIRECVPLLWLIAEVDRAGLPQSATNWKDWYPYLRRNLATRMPIITGAPLVAMPLVSRSYPSFSQLCNRATARSSQLLLRSHMRGYSLTN